MNIKRIDHIAIVVDDLQEASAVLGDKLRIDKEREVDLDDLRAVFYVCGDTRIEVIEVKDVERRPDLDLKGEDARIDHIAFEVEDIYLVTSAFASVGIQLEGAPRIVRQGMHSCFTVPATTDGVRYQFLSFE